MRLFVENIKDSGLAFEGEEQVDELTRRFARLMGEELRFVKPLSYRVKALKVDDIVEVDGSVATGCQLSCSRCLGTFSQPLEVDFSVAFVRPGKFAVDSDEDDGVELSSDELGLSLYHGDEIDLRETLYEQIVLAVPPQPLCSEDCRGLCSHCGEDLNKGACLCDPEPFNSKFSALKGFKADK